MGNARRVPLEMTEATAIALEHLIALTRRVGRPGDVEDIPAKQAEDLNWDFETHRRRQVRLGLGLSPAERLRWLEQSMEELRKLAGRARQGRPVTPG